MKHILFIFLFIFLSIFSYAQQPDAQEGQPVPTRKEILLQRLAVAQQEEMKVRSRFLKEFFPNLLKNAVVVSKYNDLDSFKKAEGARADEILSQTNSDMARAEVWLTEINNYYKKEYDDDIAAREKVLYIMNKNFRTEKPDYHKIFKDKKIIFLWEEGGHSVPEIMDSTLNVIKEIKKANPNKRILFSPEQLIWMDIEPFDKSPLIADKTDYRAPVIRFAGEAMHPNMKSATRYDDLWDKVSETGIDILNMDDVLVDESWLYSFFKVGNISIPYLGGDEMFDRAYYRFRSNYYGVFQRNTKWNYFIRTVAPYYDIIIVFAGGAHYGLKRLLNMPADKTVDVFIRKLTVDDEVKAWKKMAYEGQGTYNEEKSKAQKKRDEEISKILPSSIYNQMEENGNISAVYIIMP